MVYYVLYNTCHILVSRLYNYKLWLILFLFHLYTHSFPLHILKHILNTTLFYSFITLFY